MTAQLAEILQYQDEAHSLCTNPLEDYFLLARIPSPFISNNTALWRGYVATWEIAAERLYLVGLEGIVRGGDKGSVTAVFPDFPERVFAHWFNGTLRVPQGKMINYVHGGYGSKFERDLLLVVERGVVKATRIRHNGTAPNAPEGYRVGARLVTHLDGKREILL